MHWFTSPSGVAVAAWLTLAVTVVGVGVAIWAFVVPWQMSREAERRSQAEKIFSTVTRKGDGYESAVFNRSDAPVYNVRVEAKPAQTEPGSLPHISYSVEMLAPGPENSAKLLLEAEGRSSSGERVAIPPVTTYEVELQFQDAAQRWWHRAYAYTSDSSGSGNYAQRVPLTEGQRPSRVAPGAPSLG